MAYNCAEDDCDSTFGEGYDLGDLMFFPPPVPVAGTKRSADHVLLDVAQPTGPGVPVETEHQAEHNERQGQSCSSCQPEPAADPRPSKRKASALKVGEYHALGDYSNLDHQFPTDCFEKFCQDCDADAVCNSPCALPCEDTGCAKDDVCCDPHCDPAQECLDSCADPECSKISCPDVPCFCQTCNAQPCPLEELGEECISAHTPPNPSGTIYCYDDAPCHFQGGSQNFAHPTLPAYDGYQCCPQSDGSFAQGNVTAHPSYTNTPTLSPSNYTSLESVFSARSPPFHGASFNADCFLNISDDHCHVGGSPCCHGSSRECGDYSSAPQDRFDFYNLSLGQDDDALSSSTGYPIDAFGLQSGAENGYRYGYPYTTNTARQTYFGPASSFDLSHPLVTPDASTINNISTLDQSSWMLPGAHFPGTNKLDSLTSAVQEDLRNLRASISITDTSGFSTRPTTATPSEMPPSCMCKWQYSSGMLCLQSFDNPEALHKHIKTSHVDTCTRCFCQWEGCDACKRDFKQRSKLTRHLLGHAGHRPYSCSFEGCSKTFATNQAKDNHERTHTGDRPYVCEHCGYTTTTHTQLHTHISALHLNQKPHKCRFCDFTCADSSNLSKHERTHQNLRPYRCPHPGCTFRPDCRWENLKRHLRRSNHCPVLLIEGSEENRAYRESVRRETEEWQKKSDDGVSGVAVKKKRQGPRGSN